MTPTQEWRGSARRQLIAAAAERVRGWVFYDHDCLFCRDLAQRVSGLLGRRGYVLSPFRPSAAERGLELWGGHVPDEMKVLTTAGELLGGADALLHLAGEIWWARPLALAGRLRWTRALLRRGYAWTAARRHCLGGCSRQVS